MTELEQLRALPSVDELVIRLGARAGAIPRDLVVEEIRRALDEARAAIRSGAVNGEDLESRVVRGLESLGGPSLRAVINATGVVLHTNLGRAPLGSHRLLPGYSNLEYDLAAGRRGKRDVHLGVLFERLLGQPAIAVNNNAAAVFLALHELSAGGEVIVSRGELIEIGDGFRIPDIMARSGAVLKEVGTTNRTHLDDYRRALSDRTRLLLRVHPSNFQVRGFTARPSAAELAALGRQHGIPVYEDLGSGCLVNLRGYGIDEPLVSESLEAGINLVSFSGDKLLGGPQAGILAGDAALIARLRRNPMFRALRIDKAITQILESTLRDILFERYDAVPALAMIRQTAAEIRARAQRLLERLDGVDARLVEGASVIGGGSTPEQSIPTWLIAVEGNAAAIERRLRAGEPAVVARIEEERVVLDLRTVFPEEEEALGVAVRAAAGGV
ncbi:MAG: L-seryl-tRNA(Sec) selenium transferase [Bryobacteraceae bacterium]